VTPDLERKLVPRAGRKHSRVHCRVFFQEAAVITEDICIHVVRVLHGRRATMRRTFDVGNTDADTRESESAIEHALPTNMLYRELLPHYSLADLEATIRWLELGEYIGYTGFGFAPKMAVQLTPKGIKLAETRQLEADERKLVYQENPYSAFVARHGPLFEHLRDAILGPIGIDALDGRVDGIEAFRGEILRKIRLSRFFICILTRRSELLNHRFAASVWLYQETGAAVALGKKPLVLVEDGMDDHYAGELQKNYEYVSFTRSTYEQDFQQVGRRLQADLTANYIPLRS
jgi:hypothetical protein